MHLIATFCLVLTDSAFKTSEKVPSPSFLTSLYSTRKGQGQLIFSFNHTTWQADARMTTITYCACSTPFLFTYLTSKYCIKNLMALLFDLRSAAALLPLPSNGSRHGQLLVLQVEFAARPAY